MCGWMGGWVAVRACVRVLVHSFPLVLVGHERTPAQDSVSGVARIRATGSLPYITAQSRRLRLPALSRELRICRPKSFLTHNPPNPKHETLNRVPNTGTCPGHCLLGSPYQLRGGQPYSTHDTRASLATAWPSRPGFPKAAGHDKASQSGDRCRLKRWLLRSTSTAGLHSLRQRAP